MEHIVQIRLLGDFDILVNGVRQDNLAAKSRKGVSLMEYLILQRGRPVPVQRLIRELWNGKRYESPESALKTMVSRFRALLNSIYPGLGGCIVSEQGAYRWISGATVHVDVLDMLELLESVHADSTREERIKCYQRVLELYQGDLFQTGDICNSAMQVSWLHREFLHAMYAWIELLKETEEYEEICNICRKASQVDELDEQLHIELIRAMVKMNYTSEAIKEYKHVPHIEQMLPETGLEKNISKDYQQLMHTGDLVTQRLNMIREELMNEGTEQAGPFFCDYNAFKEFCCIQRRTMERLGSTMFLGIIMISNSEDTISSVARESAMAALCEIIRDNLRKGDIVTRVAPVIIAMLLPTVSYNSGGMVIDRIEKLFYEEFPSRAIILSSRIAPLGGSITEQK
ncbi:MAG: winged helix-turn-helix domain-containing protein [Clostridia bacterium]|nr:winged helix-turn-helix domain-containing protein [Clostridia bacterium]